MIAMGWTALCMLPLTRIFQEGRIQMRDELTACYLIDPQVVPLDGQQLSADLNAHPRATKIQLNLARMCKGFDQTDTSCVQPHFPMPPCPPPVDLRVLRADEVREAAEVSAQAVSIKAYQCFLAI